MKKKFEVNCFDKNGLIQFSYNSKYLTNLSGFLRNKTNENRYCISEKKVFNNLSVVLSLPELKGVQLIVVDSTERKIRLQNNKLHLNGEYYFMIQLSPQAYFEIDKLANLDKIFDEKIMNQKCDDIHQKIHFFDEYHNVYTKILSKLSNMSEVIIYIGDNFTYTNLKNYVNIINVDYNEVFIFDYIIEKHIKELKIDFVLVESLWEGKNNSFAYYHPQEKIAAMLECIYVFKKYNIPIVFFNKEDPIHFNHYIKIALQADFVFTIEKSTINRYKEVGIESIEYLNFFVDPELYNPFVNKEDEKLDGVFFSGSYYHNFEERKRIMELFFDYFIQKEKLEIIDRNYLLSGAKNKFPNKFSQFIKTGNLGSEALIDYIKKFEYSLNINTITNGETMIARRVFEHIALGKIIVSNYTKSLETLQLPHLIYDEENNVDKIFTRMSTMKNTYSDRILAALEIYRKFSSRKALENIKDYVLPSSKNKINLYTSGLIKNRNELENLQKKFENDINFVETDSIEKLLQNNNYNDVEENYFIVFEDNYNLKNTEIINDLIHFMDVFAKKAESVKLNFLDDSDSTSVQIYNLNTMISRKSERMMSINLIRNDYEKRENK